MNDQENILQISSIAAQMRSAIHRENINATEPEKAAALQSMALSAADSCLSRVVIARQLMGLAEAYLAAEAATSKQVSSTDIAHGVLTTAAEQLMRCGIDQAEAAQLMLGFAAAWASKSKTPGAAEHLYRTADAIVAGSAKQ